jgi:hypothetical protein
MFGRREMDRPERLADWLNERFVEFIKGEIAIVRTELSHVISDTLIKLVKEDGKLIDSIIERKLSRREMRFLIVMMSFSIPTGAIGAVLVLIVARNLHLL